ncbi:hypothetical protein EH165_06425 [Nakamurella antarctica]|uniref:ATP/GTP-binding protein n=1 Tax=Nakamurella antarctica TaxID=1902245 RepID=A0A3G8ZKZ5_9ACTN|nr:hypothetical protein EH165_06425 [Nakamurella antarctica]
MARKNRRYPDAQDRPLNGSFSRVESAADGEYVVRTIPAARALKSYRCPYCQQTIPAGTPHIVSWPREAETAIDSSGDRRHWHTGCWQRHLR